MIFEVEAKTTGRCGWPGHRRERHDVGGLGVLGRQVVQRVGVVPEDLEVRSGGRHRREPLGHLLGGDLAGRVGVGRHQPHALDRRVVGHQRGDRVGVGSGVGHRHRHHLDAEPLQQGEVPVVAGGRAEEAHRLLGAPGALGVDAALEPQVGQHVLHQREARGALGRELLDLEPEQLGEHLAERGDAGQAAVVAGVDAVGRRGRRGELEQPVGEVELLGRRLPAGEVQLEAGGHQRVVRRLLGRVEGLQVGAGQVGQFIDGGLLLAHRTIVSDLIGAARGGTVDSRLVDSHRLSHALEAVRPAGFPPRSCLRRALAQLAEHRSPKPKVGGSSPSCPARTNQVEPKVERGKGEGRVGQQGSPGIARRFCSQADQHPHVLPPGRGRAPQGGLPDPGAAGHLLHRGDGLRGLHDDAWSRSSTWASASSSSRSSRSPPVSPVLRPDDQSSTRM